MILRRSTMDFGGSHWSIRYGVAAFLVLIALALNFLPPAQALPFLFFFAAVTLSARLCGFGAAVFATVFSAAFADFFFLTPRFSFAHTPTDLVRLLLFGLVALVISSIAKQKSAAEQIADERRAQLAAIVESSEDAIFNKALDGTILTWNRGAEQLYGYRPDEIIGKNVRILVPAGKADEIAGILERVRRGEQTTHFETTRVRKDGMLFDVSLSISPIFDEQGKVVEGTTIGRDVTERKRAEDKVRLFVEAAPAAMVMVDGHGKIVLINRLTEKLFGYERHELIGLSIEQLVPHKFRHNHEQYRTNFAADPQQRTMGAGRDLYGLRKDGTEIPLEIGLNPIRIAEGFFVVAAITDISERKRAEAELRESENKLRIFVEHAPAAMAMFDRNMHYLAVSHRWLYDYGLSEDIIGRSHYEVFPEIPERWKDVHRRCLAGAVEKSDDDEFQRAQGSVQWLKWEARPWFDSGGEIGGIVIFSEDISARKKVEERLRRTEKLAAVGQLGATIAHELNNPLEAVTNLAYLMRKNKSLDEKARKQLELLNQELNRMADMTRRTLGFYRDSSSAVPVVLSELMDEVLTLYARKIESKRIDLQREYQTHAEVSAFPGEMRKVFSNLIANAIDAVASHGRIAVRVRNASDWRNGAIHGVRVAVADSGSGIGLAERNKIFEPFYTTKKDTGTGLGLWLTRDIVRSHGGSISVRSSTSAAKSCKTVFSVFIPAALEERASQSDQQRKSA